MWNSMEELHIKPMLESHPQVEEVQGAYLTSQQLQQFLDLVRAGNLFELKRVFGQVCYLCQACPDFTHVPIAQMVSGLLHLLSKEGHEASPVFARSVQLLSLKELSNGIEILMPKVSDLTRQVALLLCQGQHFQAGGGTLMENVVRHVSEHYQEEALSLASTAKKLGFSAGYLGDYFKRTANMNFTDYLISVRMEKAKALLQCSSAKAYEIAFTCGFSNPHYFSVVFKKHVGVTPTQFREQTASQVGA